MYKKLLLSMAISLAVLSSSVLMAETATKQPAKTAPVTQKTWLGIVLVAVPDMVRSQLQDIVPAGQGVMINAVSTPSPAQQAGLQQYDVLISYNNQPLSSSRQLSNLIQATEPKSKVSIVLIRHGQQKTITATLGKRDMATKPQQKQPLHPQWPLLNMPLILPQSPAIQHNNSSSMTWDSFENVQVKTLDDGRYHAKLSYKTPQGEEKSFLFEGKREDVIQQIKQQKQLPEAKKKSLLMLLGAN